jgi:hypothetical protein
MTTGMLWFNNSDVPLAQKVAEAAAFHLQKYGRAPDLCLVNPSMLTKDDPDSINGANGGTISIRPNRIVLPGHLWIGVEEMPTEETK